MKTSNVKKIHIKKIKPAPVVSTNDPECKRINII